MLPAVPSQGATHTERQSAPRRHIAAFDVTRGWAVLLRGLPTPVAIPWRLLGLALYIGVNVGLMLYGEQPGPHNLDWEIWLRLRESDPYDVTVAGIPFRYSPVAAWGFAALTVVGYWPWFALHFVAVWLLRFSPLLVLVTLTSWGLWIDAVQGGAFIFVIVAGILALRGSRGWALAYFGLLLLMPRPAQIPAAVWLLWKMPEVRVPVLTLGAVHGALVLLSGQAASWVETIATSSYDIPGPVRLAGVWWLPIGLALGAWLTWRGHLGWAGLAVSPYWLPQYLLVPLLAHQPEQTGQGIVPGDEVRDGDRPGARAADARVWRKSWVSSAPAGEVARFDALPAAEVSPTPTKRDQQSSDGSMCRPFPARDAAVYSRGR